jgi:hypothetical protein
MLTLALKSGNTIKARAKENDSRPEWAGEKYNQPRQGYTITANYKGKRFSFRFWDSIHNYQNGIECDLRGALACWACDVWAGKNAQRALDIAQEFGYENAKDAPRVFAGVKKAESQADRVGMSDEDLQELSDY